MKNSILGSLVGIAIVIALDSLMRVIISTATNQDIYMFAYSSYGGILWPLTLTITTGLTTFLGGLFTLSYARDHKKSGALLFVVLIILLRYGQIHLLISRETLFYPITALILSIGGAFVAWQIAKGNKPDIESKHHFPSEEQE
jgi:hypothetical protein